MKENYQPRSICLLVLLSLFTFWDHMVVSQWAAFFLVRWPVEVMSYTVACVSQPMRGLDFSHTFWMSTKTRWGSQEGHDGGGACSLWWQDIIIQNGQFITHHISLSIQMHCKPVGNNRFFHPPSAYHSKVLRLHWGIG